MSNAHRRFGGPGIRRGVRAPYNGGAAWQPSDDANAVRWWRADLGRTMVSTKVSAWQDQIEGVSVSQATDADRPTVGTLGGQDALSFAGSQQLRGAGFTAIEQRWLVILVAKVANSGTEIILDDGNGNASNWAIFSNATNFVYSAGSNLTGAASSDANPHAFLLDANGASSAGYLDNWSSADASGNAGTNSNDDMTVGANHADAGPMTGEVAEIIIINNPANLALYATYLTDRYSSITVTAP